MLRPPHLAFDLAPNTNLFTKMTNISLCSSLAHRTSTEEYAEKILRITDWNVTLIESCKREICGAFWGTGNPDISGTGVSRRPDEH